MTTDTKVRECREPTADVAFSDFGTQVPQATRSRPWGGASGASLVFADVAILGGLAGTSTGGAPSGALDPFVSISRTSRGVLAHSTDDTQRVPAKPDRVSAPRSDREETLWIKEHSGLTWEQLGKVFGVSRRAVHMWANGGRLNEANALRLREFSAIIQEIESQLGHANAEVVRARLLQLNEDGLSIVNRLRLERSGGPSWGAPFGPERLVNATRESLRRPVGETGQ